MCAARDRGTKKIRVYAGVLIKKRRYWQKCIPGGAIDTHFKSKEVGDRDSLHGMLDGVAYDIFCMKEPDYVMKIMATYCGLTVKDGQKESRRKYETDGEMIEKNSNTAYHSLTILTFAIV